MLCHLFFVKFAEKKQPIQAFSDAPNFFLQRFSLGFFSEGRGGLGPFTLPPLLVGTLPFPIPDQHRPPWTPPVTAPENHHQHPPFLAAHRGLTVQCTAHLQPPPPTPTPHSDAADPRPQPRTVLQRGDVRYRCAGMAWLSRGLLGSGRRSSHNKRRGRVS